MKWVFLISGIIELVGAILTYLHPQLLFTEYAGLHQFYGITVLVLAFINLLCFKFYEPSPLVRAIFMCMMFFHAVIAVLSYSSTGLVMQTGAIATHLGLFILFVFFYMQGLKPDTPS